ncbi:hypothetical protein KQX54_011578 [Cotesia glomerata]|uniref:Uncharacterized protein n=1 Tax=Cotesia glomerata TaxID=32391 RepID=A0AAV7J7I6_COTGL|nr:hypothetical protein KQX54_011578 [Cotesia glomerata]
MQTNIKENDRMMNSNNGIEKEDRRQENSIQLLRERAKEVASCTDLIEDQSSVLQAEFSPDPKMLMVLYQLCIVKQQVLVLNDYASGTISSQESLLADDLGTDLINKREPRVIHEDIPAAR